MKRFIRTTCFLALVCAILTGITSCEPKDSLTDEERAEQEAAAMADKSSKFWSVASQLVSNFEYTEEYEDKTFEPVVGTEDPSDPQTRIVSTSSSASAAGSFAALIGSDEVDENTTSYTYDDPDVGTLTYTKVTNGTAWATVDVSIKQIPHLTKIVYRSAEQGNTNGSVNGTAYYRFGDVIQRQIPVGNSFYTEYWVCVRPCFGPEDKDKSHWLSFSPLPEENVYTYFSKTNQKTYKLPTGLGTSTEHMQNLAEMLYAIFYPDKWYNNIMAYSSTNIFGSPKGLPVFKDFHPDRDHIKYHNQYYWSLVAKAWKGKRITELLFGLNYDAMKELIDTDGIRLLYAGKSWNTLTSNSPSLYEAHYTNGNDAKTANMHNQQLTKPSAQVIDKSNPTSQDTNLDFDITRLCTEKSPGIVHEKFFSEAKNSPRFVVRFATGKELGEGEHNPQLKIAGNFSDTYTFNGFYGFKDLLQDPAVTPQPITDPMVGNVIGKNTMFYVDEQACLADGQEPAALVLYTGQKGSVETGKQYRGLAVAYNEIEDVPFSSRNCNNESCYGAYTNANLSSYDYWGDLRGLTITNGLSDGCGYYHDHSAADACTQSEYFNEELFMASELSNWFMPSIGQMVLVLEQLGFKFMPSRDSWAFLGNPYKINKVLTDKYKVRENFLKGHKDKNGNMVWAYPLSNTVEPDANYIDGRVIVLECNYESTSDNIQVVFQPGKTGRYYFQPFIAF